MHIEKANFNTEEKNVPLKFLTSLSFEQMNNYLSNLNNHLNKKNKEYPDMQNRYTIKRFDQ